jgi:predicted MFS family arabinose efflux permease
MGPLSILCFVYGISLFYRGMIAVIAPELSTDLALDESSLGLLSSTFFISFAIAQVPCGLALDRLGGRLTIGLFMWFSVLGTVIFCMADGYALAFVGQVFIGIGCAPVFTGSMLFIGRRYRPEQFAYITAVVIALGSFGDLLGTKPLALLAQWLGWRHALLVPMALAAIGASFCLLWLPKDSHHGEKQPLAFMLRGMGRVITVRGLWLIMPMFLVSYAMLMAIRGLWSGPYLADVFGLNAAERGSILLAMSVAMALGTFMLGYLDRLLKRTKSLVIASSMATLIPLLLLAVYPGESPPFAMGAFIAVGLFGFSYPLLMSHCRTFLAPAYLGRGMAILTALSFIGVALVQSISGWMIESAAAMGLAPLEQYRLLFILLATLLALAIVVYAFSRPEGSADQPALGLVVRGSKRKAAPPSAL